MPSARHGRLRACLLTAAALLAPLALAAPAAAGTYDVVSCKTASGTPTSTAGWTGSSSLLYDEPADDCALGGRLTAKFSATAGGVSGGLAARWLFRAPAGTTVASAVLDGGLVARAQPGDRAAVARAAVYRGDAFDAAPERRLTTCDSAGETACPAAGQPIRLKIDAPAFGVSAGCAGPSLGSVCRRGAGSRARVAIDSARITLRDELLPKAAVSGAILDGKPVRGQSSIRLQASDEGSGVWQAEVRVGAKIVMARRTVAANGGRCRALPGTKNAFAHPQPCKREVQTTLRFPTKGTTDGSQLLTVTVWDAANNPVVAISEPVQVDNARRVQDDGTILMPAIKSASLDAPLLGGGGGTGPAGGALRPAGTGSDPQLARIIEAMNTLADARIAYCYGGGHGTTPALPSAGSYCWQGSPARKVTNSGAVGLDCSSSVSWVLQQAGYDVPTITSGQYLGFGEAGPGELLTLWTNQGHIFLEVRVEGKSYFWGTAASNPEHGPGWHPSRSGSGFTPRHIPGL